MNNDAKNSAGSKRGDSETVSQVSLSVVGSDVKVIVWSKRRHNANVSQVLLLIVVASDTKIIALLKRRHREIVSQVTLPIASSDAQE